MSESATYTKLLAAVRDNDLDVFCSTYNTETLSPDSDYDVLMEAMISERKNFVFFLLDSKCQTSKADSVNTLVHVALTNGWLDVMEKLLELDVPVSARNSRGNTAVHVAFTKELSGSVVECLLGCYLLETTENSTNADGLSMLHIACTNSNVDFLKKLVFKNDNQEINVTYNDLNCQIYLDSKSPYAGYTPLHFAVANGCSEAINVLIYNCHVDICKQDVSGSTPVHLALQRRDIEAIDIILSNNAVYQNYVNNSGLTHVMAACAGSSSVIATNFFNYTNIHDWENLSTVVNSQVKDSDNPLAGYTPLHFAAEYGRFQTVQLLYFFEALIFAKTAQNLSALVLAIKQGHEYVARLIFNYYKAYREIICEEPKDVVIEDEILSQTNEKIDTDDCEQVA